ncbi:MAG: hypothetical protein ACI8YQ_001615 [Polaribacter sp.]|jgi:hypothetical protein
MKKLVTILSLVLLVGFSAQAQNNNQDMQLEMEKAMEQMQEMMKGFGSWMADAPMFLDTTIVREFNFSPEGLQEMMEQIPMDDMSNLFFQFSPDSLMQNDMFKGMEEMMEQWSNQDMSGMEDFFKDFEKLMPEYQNPQRPVDPNTPKEKPKKKRKTTTL